MAKFRVGINYTVSGLAYVDVDAGNKADAERKIKLCAEDAICGDLAGAKIEYDICDIISGGN